MRRALRLILPLFLAASPIAVTLLFGQVPDSPPAKEPSEESQACLSCHSPEAEAGPVIQVAKLMESPHAEFDCSSCHTEFTSEAPHTPEMLKSKAACANCHDEPATQFAESVHARPSKVEGDHPTCATCHGDGDPHAVHIRGTWTRVQKQAVCSECHRDKELMARYGPNTDAVESYEHSFHGKALIRFGNTDTAICSDCHGMHDVREPTDPLAATHSNNAAKTCAQSGCHPGANVNFAMSGANHLTIKLHESALLTGTLWFFRILVFGMTGFLLFGVFLDMRRSVFGKNPPRCGRPIGLMIALGFFLIVIAILLAAFDRPGAMIPSLTGVALLVGSIIVFKLFGPREHHDKSAKVYKRLSLSLRIQHIFVMIAFTALVVTGMPVRQSDSDVLRNVYMAMGGMEVGRWIHRIAGVMLMAVFLFHILELIWKWKKAGFTFKSWTMLPSKRDVSDFVQTSKYYAGVSEEAPKYGRFQFREKLDYFAEYWGIPLMGITGLILWFPVFFSRYLPEEGIPMAFIAHSYEAVLAFLAILTWHMYNTHFNANSFPMNPVWLTGTLTHEEMLREHPLELENAVESVITVEPDTREEPPPNEPKGDKGGGQSD